MRRVRPDNDECVRYNRRTRRWERLSEEECRRRKSVWLWWCCCQGVAALLLLGIIISSIAVPLAVTRSSTVPPPAPTAAPTVAPTVAPTMAPTVAPTVAPTAPPMEMPEPTAAPTVAPTPAPTPMPPMPCDEILWLSEFQSILTFNISSGNLTNLGDALVGKTIVDIAWTPQDVLWAIVEFSELWTIDVTMMPPLGVFQFSITGSFNSMTSDDDGLLYVGGTGIQTVNVTTQVQTTVATGIPGFAGDIAFTLMNNTIYTAAFGNQLVLTDLDTGNSTIVPGSILPSTFGLIECNGVLWGASGDSFMPDMGTIYTIDVGPPVITTNVTTMESFFFTGMSVMF